MCFQKNSNDFLMLSSVVSSADCFFQVLKGDMTFSALEKWHSHHDLLISSAARSCDSHDRPALIPNQFVTNLGDGRERS